MRDITPRRYPIALLGKVGANWWVDKMSIEEYFKYYPHVLGGGMPKSKRALSLFYGNIHCEDIWQKEDWHADFLREFCLINLPHFYLNGKTRVGFVDKSRHAVLYEDGTVSRADGRITCGGERVKEGGNIFLPFRDGYCAYSERGGDISGFIGGDRAEVFRITPYGDEFVRNIKAIGGRITLTAAAGEAYYVLPEKNNQPQEEI